MCMHQFLLVVVVAVMVARIKELSPRNGLVAIIQNPRD